MDVEYVMDSDEEIVADEASHRQIMDRRRLDNVQLVPASLRRSMRKGVRDIHEEQEVCIIKERFRRDDWVLGQIALRRLNRVLRVDAEHHGKHFNKV